MRISIVVTVVLLTLCMGAGALSIYDVQYTSSRGVDNSFPSVYMGKEVTLEGVVTASDYRNEGFFISELVSGAWRGLFVNTNDYKPASGTYLRLTGKVTERFGMTCLQNISGYRVLDYNRPLPKPVVISTGQLENAIEAEAYESVYVRIVNPSTSSAKTKNGKFMVNDGSGQCGVTVGSFRGTSNVSSSVGFQYTSISGIVLFGYGEYSLNPIQSTDIQVQQPVSTQNRSWGKIKSIYK